MMRKVVLNSIFILMVSLIVWASGIDMSIAESIDLMLARVYASSTTPAMEGDKIKGIWKPKVGYHWIYGKKVQPTDEYIFDWKGTKVARIYELPSTIEYKIPKIENVNGRKCWVIESTHLHKYMLVRSTDQNVFPWYKEVFKFVNWVDCSSQKILKQYAESTVRYEPVPEWMKEYVEVVDKQSKRICTDFNYENNTMKETRKQYKDGTLEFLSEETKVRPMRALGYFNYKMREELEKKLSVGYKSSFFSIRGTTNVHLPVGTFPCYKVKIRNYDYLLTENSHFFIKLQRAPDIFYELIWANFELEEFEPVPRYAVIVSEDTIGDMAWRNVVNILKDKNQARIFHYKQSFYELKKEVSRYSPFYICFVVKPTETAQDFVASCHEFTRDLDTDPYTDSIWGIITGYDVSDAIKIAAYGHPLIVKNGLSATDKIGLRFFQTGKEFSETVPSLEYIKKNDGKTLKKTDILRDTTRLLVNELNKDTYDIFCTSGRSTENDWHIGYSYKNGKFIHREGTLWGVDLESYEYRINSQNPKIYYPAGNSLIGRISKRHCMATSWIHSGGAYTMCGYTKANKYGFIGWGIRDYFFYPGNYFTFAESFFMINQALVYGLSQNIGDRNILSYDKDIVALYGDPAWDARLWDTDQGYYVQNLDYKKIDSKRYRFIYKVVFKKDRNFDKQKPLGAILPFKITEYNIISLKNSDRVTITENFFLVDIEGKMKKGDEIILVFDGVKELLI